METRGVTAKSQPAALYHEGYVVGRSAWDPAGDASAETKGRGACRRTETCKKNRERGNERVTTQRWDKIMVKIRTTEKASGESAMGKRIGRANQRSGTPSRMCVRYKAVARRRNPTKIKMMCGPG